MLKRTHYKKKGEFTMSQYCKIRYQKYKLMFLLQRVLFYVYIATYHVLQKNSITKCVYIYACVRWNIPSGKESRSSEIWITCALPSSFMVLFWLNRKHECLIAITPQNIFMVLMIVTMYKKKNYAGWFILFSE